MEKSTRNHIATLSGCITLLQFYTLYPSYKTSWFLPIWCKYPRFTQIDTGIIVGWFNDRVVVIVKKMLSM